jgi:membrane-bound serine protease (ClpP class)
MLVLAAGAAAGTAKPRVLAIRFGPDLEVNPVTQDYVTNQLSRAAKDGYDAAVILLDTPGGLSTSMKTIYTAELNAKLPVIVYVSPDGARAASAGVWSQWRRRRTSVPRPQSTRAARISAPIYAGR